MSRGDIETYYEDGAWKNKVEGNARASAVYAAKAAAVTAGREMAMKRKVAHVVRNLDGTTDARNDYGR